ncbi:MAG: hypothetical protein CSB24_06605 [Deltaproteobacteria bacterium]|nr:MAG: hypothetical protein CSB24_06605 [Deltaproteobacteria bacterium]
MESSIKILVKGFQKFELRMLDLAVKMSESRPPRLILLEESEIDNADVVIIDGLDYGATSWAESVSDEIEKKPVIWVGKVPEGNYRHTSIKHPVIWVSMPVVISRFLDELALKEESLNGQDGTSEEQARPPAQAGYSSVLIVDDSKMVRSHLERLLIQQGYQTATAEDGEQAVAMTEDRSFDCVLMDVLMPGIDGYKACRAIRRQKHHSGKIPVIMLTSRTSPFDKVRGKMAGCDAYLTKPVKRSRLLEVLSSYGKGGRG